MTQITRIYRVQTGLRMLTNRLVYRDAVPLSLHDILRNVTFRPCRNA